MYLDIFQLVFITVVLPLGMAILMANGVFKIIDIINPQKRSVPDVKKYAENIEKEIFDSKLKISTKEMVN